MPFTAEEEVVRFGGTSHSTMPKLLDFIFQGEVKMLVIREVMHDTDDTQKGRKGCVGSCKAYVGDALHCACTREEYIGVLKAAEESLKIATDNLVLVVKVGLRSR